MPSQLRAQEIPFDSFVVLAGVRDGIVAKEWQCSPTVSTSTFTSLCGSRCIRDQINVRVEIPFVDRVVLVGVCDESLPEIGSVPFHSHPTSPTAPCGSCSHVGSSVRGDPFR